MDMNWLRVNDILVTGGHYDLEIIGSDGSVLAHQIVVSPFSPLLSNLLQMKTIAQPQIILPDFTQRCLLLLIQLLYHGEVYSSSEDQMAQLKDLIEILDVKCCHDTGMKQKSTYNESAIVDSSFIYSDTIKEDETDQYYTKEDNLLSETEDHCTMFSCSQCDKKFSLQSEAVLHELKHTDPKPRQCLLCSRKLSTTQALSKHLKIHFEENNPKKPVQRKQKLEPSDTVCENETRNMHSCSMCSQRFVLKSEAVVHEQSHTTVKPVQCTICNNVFAKTQALAIHMRTHFQEKPFQCDVCLKPFTRKYDMLHHKMRHEANLIVQHGVAKQRNRIEQFVSSKEYGVYKCNICKQTFSEYASVITHVQEHSASYPLPCVYCMKVYTRRNDLRIHLRTMHTKEFPYACNRCEKSFSSHAKLSTHSLQKHKIKPSQISMTYERMKTRPKSVENVEIPHHQTQSNKMKYQCEICAELFPELHRLRYHNLRRHSKERPFQCNICQKSFLTRAECAKHVMVHSGSKPQICEICGRSFRDKDRLRSHQKVHTGQRTYPYVCTFCNKRFASKPHLSRHTRTHTGERPHRCGVCNKDFAQGYNLKKHMTLHNRSANNGSYYY